MATAVSGSSSATRTVRRLSGGVSAAAVEGGRGGRARAREPPARVAKHGAQHRSRQLAGEGVLLARVITAEQDRAVLERRDRAVGEQRACRGRRGPERAPRASLGGP